MLQKVVSVETSIARAQLHARNSETKAIVKAKASSPVFVVVVAFCSSFVHELSAFLVFFVRK